MLRSLPGFCVVWDSAGLAVFAEVEIIGAAGGAIRLPYGKSGMIVATLNC